MLRKTAKEIYYRALIASGAISRRIAKLRKENKVAVLNLHSITPAGNDYWPPMHPSVFEGLLRFLDSKFEIRGIYDLDHQVSERPIAVLSFDDGYYDFVEYALPLLKKYKVRANMNVIPECVKTGRPIWNVRLYDFLSTASRKAINEIDVPGFSHSLQGDSSREKLDFGLRISRYLKSMSRSDRQEIWQRIEPYVESSKIFSTRMMSVDELKQAGEFADIGAHSYSHESMGFEDPTFFADDVNKCRRFFEEELGKKVDTYAFPNGSYKTQQIEYLKEQGFRNILLVDEQFANVGSQVIPRITTYGSSEVEAKAKALNF